MGFRTNIILIIDGVPGSKEEEIFDEINKWLDLDDEPPMELSTDKDGGEGGFTPMILTGRYNYFDLEAFVQGLKTLVPPNPSGFFMMQLLHSTHAYFYTSVQIFPTEIPQESVPSAVADGSEVDKC